MITFTVAHLVYLRNMRQVRIWSSGQAQSHRAEKGPQQVFTQRMPAVSVFAHVKNSIANNLVSFPPIGRLPSFLRDQK